MSIKNLDQYTTGDALAQAALDFALENIERATKTAARLGDQGGIHDGVRARFAIAQIGRAEAQLAAAKAILGLSS